MGVPQQWCERCCDALNFPPPSGRPRHRFSRYAVSVARTRGFDHPPLHVVALMLVKVLLLSCHHPSSTAQQYGSATLFNAKRVTHHARNVEALLWRREASPGHAKASTSSVLKLFGVVECSWYCCICTCFGTICTAVRAHITLLECFVYIHLLFLFRSCVRSFLSSGVRGLYRVGQNGRGASALLRGVRPSLPHILPHARP